ncbi:alpha-amylase family glycosyl hydrolase [Rubrivirga sp.]|uniref:alpha-amylase family glycosyl hydrolase n=1 Tax=Rubrivirga sp. TaxID=1885344 RepID=UPI003B52CE43
MSALAVLAGCARPAEVAEPPVTGRASADSAAAPPWTPPDWAEGAVLYEMFVPDFTPEGTFRAAAARLPELREMGVTVVWLMPIHPTGVEGRKEDLGSPYAVRDFYGVNPALGTEADFRAFVDAAHAQGLRVLLDLVANHTSPDNAWATEHPDWYTRGPDGGLTTPTSPEGQPTDWTDVTDLDYSNPGLRAEMIDVMRYWVREFDIDGYRCDVAGWVPYSFWAEAIPAVREIKPVLMLAENDLVGIHRTGFDLTYGWPEYGTMKEVWKGAPVSDLTALVTRVQAELPPGARRLLFTTNHDETAWDATPPELFGGQAGAQAAFVAAVALPGDPLVYNGQELGVDEPVPFFSRTPYDWTVRPEVRAFYDRVLEAHAASPALRSGAASFLAPDAADVLLVERTAGEDRALVAVNVRDRRSTVAVPASARGGWRDALAGGAAVTVGDEVQLGPYEFRIWTR